MDKEFLADLATFIAGLLATFLFYFSCLAFFGDGTADIEPIFHIWN